MREMQPFPKLQTSITKVGVDPYLDTNEAVLESASTLRKSCRHHGNRHPY